MPEAKRKAGQPTKYNPKVRETLEKLAKLGLTDSQMADILGVKEQTINNWKKAHPKFFESLKRHKYQADRKVKRSLYERACGYSHPEDKIFCNNGEIIVQPTIKHYPPDPTSMIFWLKNRQPEKWRDKQDLAVTGDLSITIVKFGGTDAEDNPTK